MAYLDPASPIPVSSTFVGLDMEFPVQEREVCERWIGPSGETIYFIHQEDNPKWSGFAGGNIIDRQKIDTGRIYFQLVDRGSYRAMLGLISIIKQFSKPRIHCLTNIANLQEELDKQLISANDKTSVEINEIKWIKSRGINTEHKTRITTDVNFSIRFFAKLALGLGSNILQKEYVSSEYAKQLRTILWNLNSLEKESIVKGSSFFTTEPIEVTEIITYPSAWTIQISIINEALILTVGYPNGKIQSIQITNDTEYITTNIYSNYKDGKIYIIIPPRDIFIGPINTPDFISHRMKYKLISELSTIDQWRNDARNIPD